MATRKEYGYRPDYAVLPGDTLQETLDSLSMSQKDLAVRMGRPLKTINEIIKGKAAITADTALQLERVLGTPASFWTNLERNYREALARKGDQERLRTYVAWVKRFPFRAMVKAGWIRDTDQAEQPHELLRFFGVVSPGQWENIWDSAGVAYRKSRLFESDRAAVAAWLRRGEIEAHGIRCSPFDAQRLGQTLPQMRALAVESPEVFQPMLVKLCAESGVALTFVPELPKLRVSGATRWLSASKALIQLSLRFGTEDHLWFSFFHEVGHILLHGKREAFIDDERRGNDRKEKEADRFAADILIPQTVISGMQTRPVWGESSIRSLAAKIGLPPGILVGRLQHDGVLPYSRLNHLKRRFRWVAASSEPAAA